MSTINIREAIDVKEDELLQTIGLFTVLVHRLQERIDDTEAERVKQFKMRIEEGQKLEDRLEKERERANGLQKFKDSLRELVSQLSRSHCGIIAGVRVYSTQVEASVIEALTALLDGKAT